MTADTPFQGRWTLKSCVADSDDHVMKPFGDAPSGILLYGAASVSVFMAHENRTLFPNWDPRSCEAELVAKAFNEIEAYYGRYSVDPQAQRITHTVEGAKIANIIGSDFVRRYAFDGDELSLVTIDPLPIAGRSYHLTLTWTRVQE